MAGFRTNRASWCASVVLPLPAGPLNTTSIGSAMADIVVRILSDVCPPMNVELDQLDDSDPATVVPW